MVNVITSVAVCCAWLSATGLARAQGTAEVSGIVTDAATHLPIEGALINVGPAVIRTDSSGAYELHLAPGRAFISASRGGYRNSERSALELSEGGTLRRDFELRPWPRVAGTITDADTGQPVKGCLVFAMRRISALGELWYASAGIPTADARYGTFETVGLEPGEYILEIDDCAWSYYPGVSHIEMAAPIAVTDAGIRGLNIKLKRSNARRISGVAERGAVDVRLVRHVEDVAQTLVQVRADASGHFEFPSVPVGEFYLVTSAGAHQVVEVTDRDLTDIQLRARPALPPLRATMFRDGTEVPAQAELVPVFDREPGPMWPKLNALPPGLAVASILANNIALPNGSIMIDGAVPQLTFVVTSKTGLITGTIAAKGAVVVVAIAEPFSQYLDQYAMPRTNPVFNGGESGEFSFPNLAPGRYRVFALTGDEVILVRNEAFLRKKASLAESVDVTAGATAHVELK